ncbi:c-type cytochrome [Marinobacter halodurans]|uniref:c-type cytochrome n=1 Tax=Marinobacter halodurans TaxID=2528979 RepID=UPI001A9545C1|nr:cytochrome c [Marinobacter halodurans]
MVTRTVPTSTRFHRFPFLLALTIGLLSATSGGVAADDQAELIRHGRYLTQIAGCNDCHTPGYAMSGGNVPDSAWLTGDSLGWRGPWGTTYPSNLRLTMQSLTEEQWLTLARTTQFRPPMPWFSLRDMSDQDLRAIYQFIRHQGPAGQPAPAYVPPDQEPRGPYVQFPAPTQ